MMLAIPVCAVLCCAVQRRRACRKPASEGIWSLVALSGTLVSEMRRGSMEFVSGSPITRRRIALEKLGGHVAAMTLAMLIVAFMLWLVGTVFATLPGDEIPVGAALGYALAMGLSGLTAGTLAFALAPFVGRGGAAGPRHRVLCFVDGGGPARLRWHLADRRSLGQLHHQPRRR